MNQRIMQFIIITICLTFKNAVLLLGNHCDMAHHRVISSGQALGLIEGLPP